MVVSPHPTRLFDSSHFAVDLSCIRLTKNGRTGNPAQDWAIGIHGVRKNAIFGRDSAYFNFPGLSGLCDCLKTAIEALSLPKGKQADLLRLTWSGRTTPLPPEAFPRQGRWRRQVSTFLQSDICERSSALA
jgi:hypothetical protein